MNAKQLSERHGNSPVPAPSALYLRMVQGELPVIDAEHTFEKSGMNISEKITSTPGKTRVWHPVQPRSRKPSNCWRKTVKKGKLRNVDGRSSY
jgi:hypothetical protein